MDFTIQYSDVVLIVAYLISGFVYEYTQKKQFVKLFGDLQLFKKNSIRRFVHWVIFGTILYIVSRVSIPLTTYIFCSIAYELLFHNDGEPGYFFGIGDDVAQSNATLKENIYNVSRLFIPLLPLWLLLITIMVIFRNQKIFVALILIALYSLYFQNNEGNLFGDVSSGNTQLIAVLDTGVNKDYFLDNEKSIEVFSVVEDDGYDTIGHGTSLISLLIGSDYHGISGILPEVNILSIKVSDEKGNISAESLKNGLNLAEKMGATVINLSLGSDEASEVVSKEIRRLKKQGISIVGATGDYADKDVLFPANMDEVQAVGALDEKLNQAEYSNTGVNDILYFPGEEFETISLLDDDLVCTEDLYGTSYATVFASGYVAMVRDILEKEKVTYTNDQLDNILLKLADNYSDLVLDKKTIVEYFK